MVEKYIEIRTSSYVHAIDGEREVAEAWQVRLVVGVQSFDVGMAYDVLQDAEWYRDQLATALSALVVEEIKNAAEVLK